MSHCTSPWLSCSRQGKFVNHGDQKSIDSESAMCLSILLTETTLHKNTHPLCQHLSLLSTCAGQQSEGFSALPNMGGVSQSKYTLYAQDDYCPFIFLSFAKNVLQNNEAQKAGISVI